MRRQGRTEDSLAATEAVGLGGVEHSDPDIDRTGHDARSVLRRVGIPVAPLA